MELLAKSLFAAIALSSLTANAGTVLKLNYGSIPTQNYQTSQQVWGLGAEESQELIVQFKKPVTQADRKMLISAGYEIFGYLPDDALVVRGMKSSLLQIQSQNSNINAVVDYLAQFKVSKSFGAMSVFNQDQMDSIVVQTFKTSDAEKVAQKIEAQIPGSDVQVVYGNSILVLAPVGSVLNIASMRGVEHVQPNPQMKTMEMKLMADGPNPAPRMAGDYTDLNGYETGTKVMKFDPAWTLGFTGKGQIASMADTGLDTGNLDTLSADFKSQVTKGYYFGQFSKSWSDPMGHGTHCAGSIMGSGVISGGKLKGGAYEATFIPNGMWSPMLNGLSVPSNLKDLFGKSYSDGARVHSNSWGAARNFGAYDNFASKVDDFMFANPEMLIVFAAGNSGVDKNKDGRIDSGSMSSPGTAKNALTVGASENVLERGGIQVPISKLRSAPDNWPSEPIFSSRVSDNENGVAMFSSRGPTSDGRIKPDIVAPGTNILSARSHEPGAENLWGKYNDDYVYSGGTSMATPLTAGAAVLTRQYLIEKMGLQSPSAAVVKAVLIHTADDMFPGQYGEVGADKGQELLTHRPNSDEGYGRVDVSNIVGMIGKTQVLDNKTGIGQSESISYDVVIRNGKLLANLVWTDAPGSPNAAQALVNDLDLTLVASSGNQFSLNDHINNHEIIERKDLQPGAYKLIVKGTKVPQGIAGKQPFALVYSAE